eukprot:c18539_g1_i1.p1 GENE.c18539_g1_i1~~c18539_g1_i1.p1  ORF type:complete len:433 (-),score=150.37 c18539_g1_i1:123-1421(-)
MGGEESTLNCCARVRDDDSPRYNEFANRFEPIQTQSFEKIKVPVHVPVKEGYLDKIRSEKQRKPRYFRLKNDLYYFNTREDICPKGAILLYPRGRLPFAQPCETVNHPYSFEVKYHNVHFFRAESDVIANEWKDAIDLEISNQLALEKGDTQRDLIVSTPKSIENRMLHVVNNNKNPSKLDEKPAFCLHQGYLEKKAFGSEWKKYWFVLRPGEIEFYSSKEDRYPKGVLSLSVTYTTPSISVKSNRSNILVFRNCRSLFAVAENEEEQKEWISSINIAIEQQKKDSPLEKKHPVGWKRPGKLREMLAPLGDILRDPSGLDYFRTFVKELGYEQYLLFWLEVQQYKRLLKKENNVYMKPFAIVLYDKYMKEGISDDIFADQPDLKKDTLKALQIPSISTFYHAQMHVFKILWEECYAQFLTSDCFAKFAREIR